MFRKHLEFIFLLVLAINQIDSWANEADMEGEKFQSRLEGLVRQLPIAAVTFPFEVRYQWIGGMNAGVGCAYDWEKDPTGHTFNFCAVYVSKGILGLADQTALAAIAHELAHLKRGHLLPESIGNGDQTYRRIVELDADKGGAEIFCSMGLGIEDYTLAIEEFMAKLGDYRSRHHFPLADRVEFLKRFTCESL
jgi:hypothetical protein